MGGSMKRRMKKLRKLSLPLISFGVLILFGGMLVFKFPQKGTSSTRSGFSFSRTILPIGSNKEAKVEKAGNKYDAQLAKAVAAGKVKPIKDLLKKGASLNGAMPTYSPPITIAAHKGHYMVVKDLISRKAKIDVVDAQGFTALHRAVQANDLKVLKYLVTKKANVKKADRRYSLLITGAKSKSSIIRYLVGKGANVNARNRRGETPLLAVLKTKDKSTYTKAKYLISKGAKIGVKDNNGNTARYLAKATNDKRVMKLVAPKAKKTAKKKKK